MTLFIKMNYNYKQLGRDYALTTKEPELIIAENLTDAMELLGENRWVTHRIAGVDWSFLREEAVVRQIGDYKGDTTPYPVRDVWYLESVFNDDGHIYAGSPISMLDNGYNGLEFVTPEKIVIREGSVQTYAGYMIKKIWRNDLCP